MVRLDIPCLPFAVLHVVGTLVPRAIGELATVSADQGEHQQSFHQTSNQLCTQSTHLPQRHPLSLLGYQVEIPAGQSPAAELQYGTLMLPNDVHLASSPLVS